ncbi:hypothetical protein U9M48_035623, partial [Paspalum notatum var. saurae]
YKAFIVHHSNLRLADSDALGFLPSCALQFHDDDIGSGIAAAGQPEQVNGGSVIAATRQQLTISTNTVLMAPGCVNILMHHGGAFSKQGELTYDGGDITLFQKIEKDEMSYCRLVQLAKSVGFKEGDSLYYAIPGRSLDEAEMARLPAKRDILVLCQQMRRRRIKLLMVLHVLVSYWLFVIRKRQLRPLREPCRYDPKSRSKNLNDIIYESDILCVQQLRMDRRCFWTLCSLVTEIGGLRDTRNVKVEEMAAMFLHVLAYNEKSRSMRTDYRRSQETISRHFNNVLRAVLKLWRVLLKHPQPIMENEPEERWKWFKNCLGALDGTYIKVRVPATDKPRKNEIATNVLGACAPDMQFTYVLAGWKGSAADARVLRDALQRPNGLNVPRGCYYLVDAGYKNYDGFLAPYRGQHYHLKEWSNPPTKKEELFNMRHSSARNVIERTFGLLKLRWGIIRNGSYYLIDTQIGIILACCYLHNLIRQQMRHDPFESQVDAFLEHEGRNTSNARGAIRLSKRRDKMIWTAEEEKVLTDVFYEMNDSGWKIDTGHKSGYLTFIEKELAKRLPNAHIKADPRIQSKVKTLKKLLSYVLDVQQNGPNPPLPAPER